MSMSLPELRCHWSFDTLTPGSSNPVDVGAIDTIQGVQQMVPGIGNCALRFDGFTTWLKREPGMPPDLGDAFTVEAWVTLAAFPWNVAPLLDMANGQQSGFVLGIDDVGCAVIGARLGDVWVEARSGSLGLHHWHHVLATVQSGIGVTLYVDGKQVAHTSGEGCYLSPGDIGLVIGRSREPVPATHPIRPMAHRPHDIYLDGALDEIKLWDGATTAEAVAVDFAATLPPTPAPFPPRTFPSGPVGTGRFGAFYTHLQYYDAWDRRWRVGAHPDVVVRFADEAFRFVFWRGTNYIPCWATAPEGEAKSIWYTNEFNETWGYGAIGCAEPMSDKTCAYSHVRIIETSDARVVVHWRYALVDVFGTRPRKDNVTGWTDFSDEVYTIYPDGCGTRTITLHSTQPLDPHEFQETMVVLQPGQKPDDVLELEALTMANMAGEEHTYSWAGGAPEVIDKPDRCNIQRINIKSTTKPFVIVSPRHCLKRDHSKSDRPVFPVYRNEIRPDQTFTWWNHWPTTDLPSDGRHAMTNDRAAHSSLLSGMEWEDHEVTPTSRTRVMLHGLTRTSAAGLVPLAKSWLQPPTLILESAGFVNGGYDITQRCYLVDRIDAAASELRLRFDASAEHPLANTCLLVRNWDERVRVTVDEVAVSADSGIRQGHRDRLEARDLLLWLPLRRNAPVSLLLTANEPT